MRCVWVQDDFIYHCQPCRDGQFVRIRIEIESLHNHPEFEFDRTIYKRWPCAFIVIAENCLLYTPLIILRIHSAINRLSSCKHNENLMFLFDFPREFAERSENRWNRTVLLTQIGKHETP